MMISGTVEHPHVKRVEMHNLRFWNNKNIVQRSREHVPARLTVAHYLFPGLAIVPETARHEITNFGIRQFP
jgi:hypothetical protein